MEKVIARLDELNQKVDTIIGIMQKPENKVGKILETAGAIVSVFSVLGIIDIIRHWLGF